MVAPARAIMPIRTIPEGEAARVPGIFDMKSTNVCVCMTFARRLSSNKQ
ncbi:hypothetical protein EDC40_103236 [Aminobacter aminovorans]|uniref:Uncharacterized protein n=1 Tax=Aminobacter aminovorans TaxID=83263 RepID=A0A380WLZ9_AMIAI|nr:hypothetical protein EDC40_103236 [Aminobacter aminovorans]SUU89818.1 Uncharacterised protein [Aminobacter aminovorans]